MTYHKLLQHFQKFLSFHDAMSRLTWNVMRATSLWSLKHVPKLAHSTTKWLIALMTIYTLAFICQLIICCNYSIKCLIVFVVLLMTVLELRAFTYAFCVIHLHITQGSVLWDFLHWRSNLFSPIHRRHSCSRIDKTPSLHRVFHIVCSLIIHLIGGSLKIQCQPYLRQSTFIQLLNLIPIKPFVFGACRWAKLAVCEHFEQPSEPNTKLFSVCHSPTLTFVVGGEQDFVYLQRWSEASFVRHFMTVLSWSITNSKHGGLGSSVGGCLVFDGDGEVEESAGCSCFKEDHVAGSEVCHLCVKIDSPNCSVRSIMQKYLEKTGDIRFEKIFNQRLGFLLLKDFAENVSETSCPQIKFYEAVGHSYEVMMVMCLDKRIWEVGDAGRATGKSKGDLRSSYYGGDVGSFTCEYLLTFN